MSERQKSEEVRPSQIVVNIFDAWELSADLGADSYKKPVTVGGVTVTHKGPYEAPIIEVAQNIEIQT